MTMRAVVTICETPELTALPLLQRRIFFVWTVREMAASEWFMELLRDLKQLDLGDVLSISVHVTGHMPQPVSFLCCWPPTYCTCQALASSLTPQHPSHADTQPC